MRRNNLRLGKWLLLFVPVLLSGAAVALSDSGPDFTGLYWAREVTDLGEQVRVRLTVEVFNHTSADVVGATLTIEHPLWNPDEPVGVFLTKFDIRTKEHKRVSEEFVVPRIEFEQWQKGRGPHLRLDFRDAAGTDVRQHVPVIPMPLPEED